jgi:hypothetical protein
MISEDFTDKPWAVTPEKIAEAVRCVLRGLLMPIDLIVTSQALYDSRARVPGTVELAARTQGLVLYAED